MIKKLKTLFLSIFVLFGLASCIQTQPTTKYSFKDITNHEVTDIVDVFIKYGPMVSSIDNFNGDYETTFDVEYILSDMPYNETRNIMENYRFRLFIDFNTNDLSYCDIEMFIYEYKIYYFSNDSLYESLEKVDYDDFYTSVPPIEEVHTLNTIVMYDYGMHISGKLTTLLNGNLIWFNPKDYGINELVAGDELIIKYTGEYEVQEIYPGGVNADKMHIQSIEVIEADIVEFTVSAIPGNDELDLVPIDSKYNNYILSNEGYVLSQDGTFKKYDQYPERTVLYASLPKSTNSIRVDGLYDYYPRNEQEEDTGQFELQIIDHTEKLITGFSSAAGFYTPGTILEFYFTPITDYKADIVMYINNKHYEFHKTLNFSSETVWGFAFEMSNANILIEFYIVQYMPCNNNQNNWSYNYEENL